MPSSIYPFVKRLITPRNTLLRLPDYAEAAMHFYQSLQSQAQGPDFFEHFDLFDLFEGIPKEFKKPLVKYAARKQATPPDFVIQPQPLESMEFNLYNLNDNEKCFKILVTHYAKAWVFSVIEREQQRIQYKPHTGKYITRVTDRRREVHDAGAVRKQVFY